jgi:hypothetical protein
MLAGVGLRDVDFRTCLLGLRAADEFGDYLAATRESGEPRSFGEDHFPPDPRKPCPRSRRSLSSTRRRRNSSTRAMPAKLALRAVGRRVEALPFSPPSQQLS